MIIMHAMQILHTGIITGLDSCYSLLCLAYFQSLSKPLLWLQNTASTFVDTPINPNVYSCPIVQKMSSHIDKCRHPIK